MFKWHGFFTAFFTFDIKHNNKHLRHFAEREGFHFSNAMWCTFINLIFVIIKSYDRTESVNLIEVFYSGGLTYKGENFGLWKKNDCVDLQW